MKLQKAQTLAEYSILAGLIIAALLGMQLYVKRGLQARYKKVVDVAGEVAGVQQYEPYYTQSSKTISQEDKTKYTHKPGGEILRDIDSTVKVENATITGTFNTGNDDEWN